MILIEAVAEYCDSSGIEKITAQQYERSVNCFGAFLGRPALIEDLVTQQVNRWLRVIGESKSACTVRNRLRGLTPVWNWLAMQGKVAFYNPRSIRKVKVTKNAPKAWSLGQIEALLEAAQTLEGRVHFGPTAAELMNAWVLLAYETALRPSDLLLLRFDCFDYRQNLVTLTDHKTGNPNCLYISDRAMSAVKNLDWGQKTVFGLTKSGMRRWELKLFSAAKSYGFERQRRQATGTIRKTAATETTRIAGIEAAAALLNHRSGSRVTLEHYVAPEALAPRKMPVALCTNSSNSSEANSNYQRTNQPTTSASS